MMQSINACGSNVHTRSFSNSLKTLEDLNTPGRITMGNGSHLNTILVQGWLQRSVIKAPFTHSLYPYVIIKKIHVSILIKYTKIMGELQACTRIQANLLLLLLQDFTNNRFT